MLKKNVLTIGMLVVSVLLATLAMADTITITTSQSGVINSTWPMDNYGWHDNSGSNGGGFGDDRMMVGKTNKKYRSLIMFTGLDVLAGKTITSATLRMHSAAGGSGGYSWDPVVSINDATASWKYKEVTWDYRWDARGSGPAWTTPGGDKGSEIDVWRFGASDVSWHEASLPTSLVESWVNGDNYGLILESHAGTWVYRALHSADSDGYEPQLVVEYVPEPATMLVLIVGGCLGLLRRKA